MFLFNVAQLAFNNTHFV